MTDTVSSMRGRIDFIDCAKGISMLLVITLHSNLTSGMANSFFLGMFFLTSGMLFKDNGKSLSYNFIRYLKKFLIPYWLCMLLFSCLDCVRAAVLGYSDSSIFFAVLAAAVYGSAIVPHAGALTDYLVQAVSYKEASALIHGVDIVTPLTCHLWFLPAMFCAQMTVLALMRHRGRIALPVWILLLLGAVFLEYLPFIPSLPYCLSRGFLGAAYMLCGILAARWRIFEIKNPFVLVLSIAAACAAVYGADMLGTVNTAWILNIYGPYGALSGVLAFFSGLLSCYAALHFCRLLSYGGFSLIKRMLCALSINSMTVYIWHLLVLNAFAAVYIVLDGGRMSPDPFMMDLICQGSVLYRIAASAAAAALLTGAGIVCRRYVRGKNLSS